PTQVAATDNCGTPQITCDKVDGVNGCVHTRTLTYTARDACGNFATCAETISWTVDTTTPTFTKCPANVNLGCNPTVILACYTSPNTVVSTDDCGVTNISCSKLDSVSGCVHTRRLVYTATDGCGNKKTCTQTITWTVDTAPPSLVNCPASSLNLGCNPTSIPTCSSYNVNAVDGCGNPTISCTSDTVTNGCVRRRTLTYTAKDPCGNTASCSQVITWTVDSVGPVLVGCPTPTLDRGCNPDPATIPTCAIYDVTATDDCSTATVTCTNITVTNGCVRTRTLTWTAKDACSNSSTCSQIITWVVDTTAPVFTKCPPTLHLGCNPTV